MVPPNDLQSTAFQALAIASGACWGIAYFLIIRRGIPDRSYGIPAVAVCVNISWEFVFTFLIPHESPQWYVNFAWFLLDLFILGQVLFFWRSDFPYLEGVIFCPFAAVSLVASFGLIFTMAVELEDCNLYSAFGQNYLMSILFLTMLFHRNSLRGQSIYIAISKMAGSALACIISYLFVPLAQELVVLRYIFVAIVLFDLSYIAAVYYFGRKQGTPVWTRL